MESARKQVNTDSIDGAKRSAEMAAYFTHCQLHPVLFSYTFLNYIGRKANSYQDILHLLKI